MNTAGRLLSIYDKLTGSGFPNDKAMVWVWASVFELPEDTTHLEDVVANCLIALREEIRLLESQLLVLGISSDLTHPGLTRLRNVSSMVYLNGNWGGLRDEASKPENRLTLSWANWALRETTEDDLPNEELIALHGKLDSLEVSLRDIEMTPYLRSFVQRQIDVIRAALRLYRVQGIKPIDDALKQVAGACALDGARVAEEHEKASEPAKTVLSRMGEVIGTTAKFIELADKAQKMAEGLGNLASNFSPLLLSWVKN